VDINGDIPLVAAFRASEESNSNSNFSYHSSLISKMYSDAIAVVEASLAKMSANSHCSITYCDPKYDGDRISPLIHAVRTKQQQMVKFLLK
jgi:hypothetical protein